MLLQYFPKLRIPFLVILVIFISVPMQNLQLQGSRKIIYYKMSKFQMANIPSELLLRVAQYLGDVEIWRLKNRDAIFGTFLYSLNEYYVLESFPFWKENAGKRFMNLHRILIDNNEELTILTQGRCQKIP